MRASASWGPLLPKSSATARGAWEDVDGGMATAESGAFVHLQGNAGGGVGEGGHGGLGFEVMAEEGGGSSVGVAGGKAGEVCVFGQAAAADDCADGVHENVGGGGASGVGEAVVGDLAGEFGELGEVVVHGLGTSAVVEGWVSGRKTRFFDSAALRSE